MRYFPETKLHTMCAYLDNTHFLNDARNTYDCFRSVRVLDTTWQCNIGLVITPGLYYGFGLANALAIGLCIN